MTAPWRFGFYVFKIPQWQGAYTTTSYLSFRFLIPNYEIFSYHRFNDIWEKRDVREKPATSLTVVPRKHNHLLHAQER